jgi:hypothetical protein
MPAKCFWCSIGRGMHAAGSSLGITIVLTALLTIVLVLRVMGGTAPEPAVGPAPAAAAPAAAPDPPMMVSFGAAYAAPDARMETA